MLNEITLSSVTLLCVFVLPLFPMSFRFLSSRESPPFQSVQTMGSKMLDLDSILKKYTSEIENHLNGATFIVVNDKGDLVYKSHNLPCCLLWIGETLYAKAFGNRTFDSSEDAPLQTDSTLSIYSLTKLVTSVASMIAVEQGLITLDENVRDIVPELNNLDLLVGFEDGESPRKPILQKVTTPITLR